MKKTMIYRILFYIIGLITLSAGIMLNTKVNLGVSCVTGVPFSVSEVFGIKFSRATFVVYMVIFVIEMILRGKKCKVYDLLQIPFTLVFSAFLDFFGALFTFGELSVFMRFVIFGIAVVLIAIGAAMSVGMKFVPNPPDGLAAAIGEALGKGMGFGKNFLDIACVATTLTVGLVFGGKVIGIGIGTLIAMIGVGRCVALFNKLVGGKLKKLAGLE